MSERKREIEKQLKALHQELNEMNEQENQRKYGRLVGQCFVYRNCYSCPEKPGDYWNVYIRVNKVVGCYVDVLLFEIDNAGRITIDPSRTLPASMMGASYMPVTEVQFNKQKTRFLNSVGRVFEAPHA